MFKDKIDLRIPGPTPVPPEVLQSTALPVINHRGASFHDLYPRVRRRLQHVFQTDDEVFILTGSGTCAMEAAVANLVAPGTEVLVLIAGAFGERWARICRRYGAEVHELNIPWGEAVQPQQVEQALTDHPGTRVVFATHNESSTGVAHDICSIARVVKSFEDQRGEPPLLVVDAVSSLGGIDLRTKEWGVDVVVSASQKCLMMPPGIAMLSISAQARQVMRSIDVSSFYLDLSAYEEFAGRDETPFTPNVQLIGALDEALALIEEEGLESVFGRHLLMRDMIRTGLFPLGLKPVVSASSASPTVTAVWAPKGIKVDTLRRVLREEFETEVAGGQRDLAGKIFRIGHMGFATPVDMLRVLAAVELSLRKLGMQVELGAGVRAAQEVLLKRQHEG